MLNTKKLLTKMMTSISTLFAHLIAFENKSFSGQYTIGNSGYVSLGSAPSPITGSTVIVCAFVYSWSANTGAFSVALGSGNVTYLVGTPGAKITDPAIRYAYFGGGTP